MTKNTTTATCTTCGSAFAERRAALGYKTCLKCGDGAAKAVKFCIAPVAKSNYVVVSDKRDLKGLNKYANS